MDGLLALWARIPPKAQKALTDFWTVLVAGVVALSITLPDPGDWRNWAVVTAAAIANVAVNAARRALVAYLLDG